MRLEYFTYQNFTYHEAQSLCTKKVSILVVPFLCDSAERFKYYLVLFSLTMESITIKVEDNLVKEIDKAMKPYYSTKTEFIREAIRDKLIDLKKSKLQKFRAYFGSSKVKPARRKKEK